MDEMPSAEFRKTYAKLTRPTLVTVNGHRIGVWTPTITTAEFLGALSEGRETRVPMDIDPTFSSRPFTPVPKRGKG